MSQKSLPVLVLRSIQVFCTGVTVTGFVWGSSDFLLTTALVGVPITPLSVLMMLYGGVGSIVCEAAIRLVGRRKNSQAEAEPTSA